MTAMPQHRSDSRLDPMFVERERNRFAGRALGFLVVLNGAGALIMLSILAQTPADAPVDSKYGAAMLFFAGGTIAALLSSFIAYVNRSATMTAPERENMRAALQGLAIAIVIGSGAAFFTAMNMVATAASERSSSHPKGSKEQPKTKGQDQQQPDPLVKPSRTRQASAQLPIERSD